MFPQHKIFGQVIDFSNPGEVAAHLVAHAASLSALGGIVMHSLPLIYGVFPAAYYCALFLGTPLVQKWVRLRRAKKRKARLTRRSATSHNHKR